MTSSFGKFRISVFLVRWPDIGRHSRQNKMGAPVRLDTGTTPQVVTFILAQARTHFIYLFKEILQTF